VKTFSTKLKQPQPRRVHIAVFECSPHARYFTQKKTKNKNKKCLTARETRKPSQRPRGNNNTLFNGTYLINISNDRLDRFARRRSIRDAHVGARTGSRRPAKQLRRTRDFNHVRVERLHVFGRSDGHTGQSFQ